MDPLNAPAGRDLDQVIAERVMGWKATYRSPRGHLTAYGDRTVSASGAAMTQGGRRVDFSPSRCIEHAWEVVCRMANHPDTHRHAYWWNWWHAAISIDESGPHVATHDPSTMPLAICRAALLAIGEDPEGL